MMLELDSVSFGYRGTTMIDNLSCTIGGGVSVILGPNGAGKTTLLDLCLGWRRPAAGKISLDGVDLGEMSPRERGRSMSLVPQRENIRFEFSVEDYVLLGRAPYLPPLGLPGREDLLVARKSMEETGIDHLRKRPVTTLSGGEYQLMLIARSLSQKPRLLLLDEPTSQLDPAHRIEVLRKLKAMANLGITVVFTSHSPETASIVADEVLLLEKGRIRRSGPPSDVLNRHDLQAVYGVPFSISWVDGRPYFRWDVSESR